MKRIKLNKPIERIAREVKDSDEFLEHIANISRRYREEHALDSGSRATAVRRALKVFRRHSAPLIAWLGSAQKHARASGESEAFKRMAAMLDAAPTSGQLNAASMNDWLSQADRIAARCLQDPVLRTRKSQQIAPRVTAEALRATFEHHDLKVIIGTKAQPGSIVRLLCAIAQNAGDRSVNYDVAKKALGESAGRRKTPSATTQSAR